MELSFLLIGIGLIVFSLAFVFFRASKTKQLQKKLSLQEEKIKKSRESEQQLEEELSLLRNKLQSILEDPVTNLLGWKIFEDRLKQSIKESERYQLTLGVLFIDIDNFSVINDTLGYEIGDELLQAIATRLKSCIRQVDSLSRFAKDTFVVLLLQLSRPETAAIVAQRILQSFAQPFQVRDHELYVTACIGISIYPNDAQDGQSLLRCASQAVHLAKEKGKHLYQFYQEQLYLKSQRELALLTRLNHESVFQEFRLYFQPIVNVDNEAIVCMETLLYWQHAELGLIQPVELFNCAEKQGKLNIITEWLLQRACKQFLHWRSLGFDPGLLSISISIKQLENSHFIYRISQILQELEFKPECLLLEIQEGSVQLPFAAVEKAFNMLSFMGVKTAIDHFGTGLFSLDHLKNLPIHYLKLDPVLTQDIHTNADTIALVKSLVELAKNMSKEIIVQGVESEEQINILKELGCTLMQGHLLGAPLPETEVTNKMAMTSSS